MTGTRLVKSTELRDGWDWTNKVTPTISGGNAEALFKVQARRSNPPILTYSPDDGCDYGCDTITMSKHGGTHYIQVTTGSNSNPDKPYSYCINKPISKIVDYTTIVAVHIRCDGRISPDGHDNLNDHFFLLPRCVYTDPRMYLRHHNSTSTFWLNMDQTFKKPMDVAYENWNLLHCTVEEHEKMVDSFFLDVDKKSRYFSS